MTVINELVYKGKDFTEKQDIAKVKNKFEIEKYVNVKNNTLDKLKRKWATNGKLLLYVIFLFSVRNRILLWLRTVCNVISCNVFIIIFI